MEPKQFDRLARAFGEGQSRRGVLKTIAGGALGAVAAAVGLADADAKASKRNIGGSCSKNSDCLSNVCLPKNRQGRRVCGCGGVNDCPTPADQCQQASCIHGVCGSQLNSGASCYDGNFCTTGETCQPNGSCGNGTPVTCPPAINECYLAGTCDPGFGCSAPTYNNGASCLSGAGICADGECIVSTTTGTSRPSTTTSTTRTSTTTGTTQTSTTTGTTQTSTTTGTTETSTTATTETSTTGTTETSTTGTTETSTTGTGTTAFGSSGVAPAALRMSFEANRDLAAFASAANNVGNQMRGKTRF